MRPNGSLTAVERAVREPFLLVIDETQVRARHNWQEQCGQVALFVGSLTKDALMQGLGESIDDPFCDFGGALE